MTAVALIAATVGLLLMLHGLRGLVFSDQVRAQIGEGLVAASGVLILVGALVGMLGIA